MTGTNWMAEEDARIEAAANTPERIAADAAQMERNRIRMAAELASLERQGMIDSGSDDDDDDDDAECEHRDTGRGVCAHCGEPLDTYD